MAYITALRLTDFRSYPALDLELSGAPVVLFGPNGSGKTNLLEAISFLSPGRGLRRAKIDAMTRRDGDWVAPAWGVRANLITDTEPIQINVGQIPEAPRRRTIRIDGKTATGGQLAAQVKTLWLTPAQDRLFTGGASDRRRFLDRLALAQSPSHGQTMLRYEKARSERNRLLSDGIDDDRWYGSLENSLAEHGAKIAAARVETLKALTAQIHIRTDTTFPKATLSLEGEVEAQVLEGDDVETVTQTLCETLERERPLHRRAGRTLTGIHRSDLLVTYAAKAMPAAACSTGEQKALLITLMLAHARAQAQYQPILLLDEIAAHLDVDRRAAMIEELIALGTQVFMTGTDASLFEAFAGRAQLFSVKNSALEATQT